MTRSQSLHAALAGDAAIAALVQERIYPLLAQPPDSRPTLSYEFSVTCEYNLDTAGPVTAFLDIRSWASDYDVAHQLADAVQSVLMPTDEPKGYNSDSLGPLGGEGGIDVIQCLWAMDGARETESFVTIAPDKFMFEIISPYELLYNL